MRTVIKWVKKANNFCLTAINETKKGPQQKQYWFHTEAEAEEKVKELNE